MNKMTSKLESYKCNWCGKTYEIEVDSHQCVFNHAKENFANSLLDAGKSLDLIKFYCGFNWDLTEEQAKINKDNCFTLPSWQCCKYPAYQIKEINNDGKLKLWGKGGGSGYYEKWIEIENLPEPHPKEDLFIDPNPAFGSFLWKTSSSNYGG